MAPLLGNITSIISAMQGANSTKAIGVGGAIPGKSTTSNTTNNEYGYGLVNSDLARLSYRLPNGEISSCNTIGVG